jgi:hypothetical protein
VTDFVSKTIPHNALVPAQSPFHKQLTQKSKDSRLCYLLAANKLPEFHYDLPQNRMWLAQFVCKPQFFETPKGLCGHTVY